MDAISPESLLTLAPGEPKPEPREWRYDMRQHALLHVPTRAIFHVYRVLSRPPSRCMDDPNYDEASMRARLIHIHDGFPMPPPDRDQPARPRCDPLVSRLLEANAPLRDERSPSETASGVGVRRLSLLAGMDCWRGRISVRSGSRVCRCGRHSEPVAGDRHRAATSASAAICSSGGSPGNWPSLR
jgi:hypothetical protein